MAEMKYYPSVRNGCHHMQYPIEFLANWCPCPHWHYEDSNEYHAALWCTSCEAEFSLKDLAGIRAVSLAFTEALMDLGYSGTLCLSEKEKRLLQSNQTRSMMRIH